MATDVRRTRPWRRLVAWAKLTLPWVCHLCGQDIPRNVTRFHPESYALDHVLPVSTHPELALSFDNVKPSHKQCNDYRKARPLTPGLKLEIAQRFAKKTPQALDFFASLGEGGGKLRDRE